MIIAAWVLLLVLLTWFFNDRLDEQRNPNQQVHSAVALDGQPEIRLQRNRFGHYVATGFINGQAVEFMLDTGASDVSVPVPVAEELGLRKGQPVLYRTANGTIRAWQTVIEEIRLGELRIGPVRASINPGAQGDDILLGMSFLKQLDFSQQGNTLTLRYATGP
jgi:aspartyl protease family protein